MVNSVWGRFPLKSIRLPNAICLFGGKQPPSLFLFLSACGVGQARFRMPPPAAWGRWIPLAIGGLLLHRQNSLQTIMTSSLWIKRNNGSKRERALSQATRWSPRTAIWTKGFYGSQLDLLCPDGCPERISMNQHPSLLFTACLSSNTLIFLRGDRGVKVEALKCT